MGMVRNRKGNADRDSKAPLILDNDGAERLAIAIVKQAADDYERTLMEMLRKPSPAEMKKLQAKKAENERFFQSEWFDVLVQHTDGKRLMKQIQKNAVRKEKERVEKKLKKAKDKLEGQIRKGV